MEKRAGNKLLVQPGALAAVCFLVALLGFRIGAETSSVTIGVLSAVGFLVVFAALVFWQHRKAESSLAALDSEGSASSVKGNLQISSLPPAWRTAASECLGFGAGQTDALAAEIFTDGPWLRIHSSPILGQKKHPFRAQVPLAEVTGVYVEEPWLAAVGVALSFLILEGYALKLDLIVGNETAERVAARFTAEAAKARASGIAVGRSGVTSPAPPPRTDPGKAGLMMLVTMIPWLPAMLLFQDGIWAGVTTSCVLFLALIMRFVRSRNMAFLLLVGTAVSGIAFVVDYVVTAKSTSLFGVPAAVLAAYLLNRLAGSAKEAS